MTDMLTVCDLNPTFFTCIDQGTYLFHMPLVSHLFWSVLPEISSTYRFDEGPVPNLLCTRCLCSKLPPLEQASSEASALTLPT